MATRRVRPDDKEKAVLQQRVDQESARKPYDVYQRLDLGPGGYAVSPSTETRRGVAAAEVLGTRQVFTIGRKDFETYRMRRGHRHHAMQIVF